MNGNGVFDTMINFCPVCGADIRIKNDKLSMMDYMAGASHSCNCGFRYQKVTTEQIHQIAKDLAFYSGA